MISEIKDEIKNEIPDLTNEQLDKVSELISNREKEFIKLLLFLKSQVTDNCCHAILDEDDCLDKIEEILNKK